MINKFGGDFLINFLGLTWSGVIGIGAQLFVYYAVRKYGKRVFHFHH